MVKNPKIPGIHPIYAIIADSTGDYSFGVFFSIDISNKANIGFYVIVDMKNEGLLAIFPLCY